MVAWLREEAMRRVRGLFVLTALVAAGAAQAGLIAPDDPWARDAVLRAADARLDTTIPDAWPRWKVEETPLALSAEAMLATGRRTQAPIGFGAPVRGDGHAALGLHLVGTHWDARLVANQWRRVDHGPRTGPDGSWLAFGDVHWAVFAGWVPQWWGPGWDGSLILSQAARPRPTLGLLARGRWLGGRGWEVRTFLARLENARPVPHPLHWGLRLSLRATEKLSLALERVAQICGRNRPCGLSSWGRMLVGLDNAGQGGVTFQNQPGNQLGGVSLRWRSPLGEAPYAIYAQGAGEDEAGKLPSKWFWLVGAEVWGGHWRAFVEYADTRAGAWYRRPELGTVYNHGVYRMGYRAWNRPLGFSLDGDARLVSVGALGTWGRLKWMGVLRRWKLARGPVRTAQQQFALRLSYAMPWGALEAQGAAGDHAWGIVGVQLAMPLVPSGL